MLDKLQQAFSHLRKEVQQIKTTVDSIQKIKPIVTNGIDGKDGRDAPELREIVEAVLKEIPEPKLITVDDVLNQIPKPKDGRDGKDGRDAPPVSVSDVATVVLSQIDKPKDGRDAPDLKTIVENVNEELKAQAVGPQGPAGPRGPKGPKGDKGTSVTDVQLSADNELSVFLDGVKKKVGKIKIPKVVLPFSPGGGGSFVSQINGNHESGWADYADTEYTDVSPFIVVADTDTILPNDGLAGPKFEEPPGVNFYENGKITGRNGDALSITMDMVAVPQNGNATILETWIDIGGAVGELYRRLISFPKGAGVVRPINFTTIAYTLDTWQANGGTVYVRCNGPVNIYNIRYVLARIHKANGV